MRKLFLTVLLSNVLLLQLVQSQEVILCTDPKTPYLDPTSQKCLACADATPLWNDFDLKCVATCPAAAPAYDTLNWCYICPTETPVWNSTARICTECSGETPNYNPYTGLCVTDCPDYIPDNNTNPGVCAKCPAGAPYWSGGSCISECSPPKPVNDSINVCQPCDSSTPYWDAGSGRHCLSACPILRPDFRVYNNCQACPDETPKWNRDAQNCESCTSSAPYFLKTTGDCVIRCADAYQTLPTFDSNKWCTNCSSSLYWDNINSICTSSCPRQTPTNNVTGWCTTCPTTSPKWNNISRSCTDTCPSSIPATDSDNWCVSCSRDIPYWSTADSSCEKCPDETPYWDTSSGTGTCVITCPVSRPFADSDRWCMPCNSSYPYWDTYSSSGSCVATCPTIAPAPDTNKWCKPCIVSKPYWNPATSSCLVNCPSSRPIIDSNNWCLSCPSTTPKWDPALQQCVTTCPIETPATDSNKVCVACTTALWDPSTSACVSSCDGLAPIKNGIQCDYCPSNLPNWDSSIPACVSSCPDDKPFLNSKKWCQACGGVTPYWNSLSSQCVTTCPQARPAHDSLNRCQPCPNSTPKWDPVTMTCLANCQGARPVTGAFNWCQACQSGTPFWNPTNAACVASCPPQIPMMDANSWCLACPSSTPKWDSIPTTCVTNCPPSRPVIGSYNWCKACPAETPYWNSGRSVCMASCPPQTPMIDANNWCKACPSDTPYWDSAHATCVTRCPQDTPSPDNNKHCHPCSAEFPTWNEVTMQCLRACPLDRPVVDANNLCQECPSATPYWNTLKNVCVALCPPQTPSVSPGNWCSECTGSTLKWNPTSSECVATCSEDLPFFNTNSVPPACEQGPDVQYIIDYLQTSGIVVPVTLGGIQLVLPGLPYAAVTILLMSLLKYVRYFNINFPAKLSKVFQQGTLNIPSLNFGPFFPEDWRVETYSHPAPYRFAQYDINGLFIANFWRGISTALIIAAGVGLMKVLARRKLKNETAGQAIDTGKNFLIWNYVFSFFISNISNITLYIFIEYQSLSLHDGLGAGSLLVNIVFVQLSLFGIVYMIKRIKNFYKLNKQAVKNEEKLKIDQSIKVLLEKFNHENLTQMLFIPILCIRAIINSIIISTLDNPIIQCSLLIVLNLLMIAYNIRYHPYRLLLDNLQVIGFETILFIVNVTCLHLGTLSVEEQLASEGAGNLIITSNVIMFALSFVFTLIKIILFIAEIIRERYALKRPSCNISVQTDDSSVLEMTPTSEKCARLETSPTEVSPKINKKATLNLSFAGSVSMEIGVEGDLSPGIASTTRNLNSNNVNRSFHIVRIPEGEDESQHLSRYVDTGV